ncbi:MAG TPA: response regulator transcription factor [Chloroflexia bacterium]|jgi:DNA-binding NarL/FixJ family response regulator|nr:response regulator transcription factor [Chloroflexia bacterium]
MHLMNEIHPARVVLAEPRADVRSALRLLVTDALGMHVVGEVANAADLWSQLRAAQPELLLLDWGMVAAQATTLVPALHATWPGLHIIALSGRTEVEPAVLQAGADAFISKTDPPERLLEALQAVRMGDPSLGPGPGKDSKTRTTPAPEFPAAPAPSSIIPSTDPAERLQGTPGGTGNEPMNGAPRRRKDPMT